MNRQKLQALFFDFDGVIIDSTSTKTEGFRALFDEYGTEIVEKVVEYHQLHGGISRVDKIEYAHRNFLKRPLSKADLDCWGDRFSDLVVKKVIGAHWVAGAKEFLDEMLGKVPICVISGTPETELKYILEQRSMSFYFQEILGSPIRKPEHIRNLLSKYSLNPTQCVFVGDAMTDYNAALETGLNFVGIKSEIEFPPAATVLKDCTGLLQPILAHLTL
jgi:phosphoglycolate phosphatase-like HAD superfamily hydrolase